jgi:lipopolysaccharide export system permease protein
MRISGMKFQSIIVPVAVLSILCFILNTAVSFYIGPKSSIKLRDEITNIIKMRTPLAIEEGRFNTSFKGILIYVNEKPSDTTVRGIFIYDSRDRKESKVLIAKEGIISAQEDFKISFFLKDGYMNMVGGDTITEVFFEKYNMLLHLESDTPSRKNAELTPHELWQRITMTEQRYNVPLYLELYRRFSLPLLCIILIFFGPPLALMAGKSGKLGGLALGLTVFTGYYMVLIYGENLVRAGKVPHYVGSCIPMVIFVALALVLFRRAGSR